MRALPQVKGYTVDHRLQEFRRLEPGPDGRMEFIPFDSALGERLLRALRAAEARKSEPPETEG